MLCALCVIVQLYNHREVDIVIMITMGRIRLNTLTSLAKVVQNFKGKVRPRVKNSNWAYSLVCGFKWFEFTSVPVPVLLSKLSRLNYD